MNKNSYTFKYKSTKSLKHFVHKSQYIYFFVNKLENLINLYKNNTFLNYGKLRITKVLCRPRS